MPYHPRQRPKYDLPLAVGALEAVFQDAEDFVHRTVFLGGNPKWPVHLYFIDGLVSGDAISDFVVRPLVQAAPPSDDTEDRRIDWLKQGGVYNAVVQTRHTVDEAALDLVNGFCVALFEKQNTALSFETKSQEKRSVSEPTDENVLKGAKDAFVEVLRTNTALLRRHIRTPDLRVRERIVGRRTLTRISVVSIQGLTNPQLVQHALAKLDDMDVDGVLSSSALEEYLTDDLRTPFPLMLYTERADRFAAGIMGGRVGILIDGLPMGYLLPTTLAQFMIAPEDRANNHIQATMLRLVRYLALWLNLLLPGFYLAVATFHQEMIPTPLLRSIIQSKQDVPFPTVFELFGLLFAFEILQEAGLHLPKTIGQTVSIIGGLIVGQAAVDAKVLSPVIIIVVAVTGIAGYTIPNRDFAGAIRLWRFLLACASAVFGMFGTVTAGLALLYHLARLESFGVPYLSPHVAKDGGHTDGSGILRPTFPSEKYRNADVRPKNLRRRK